MQNQCPTKTSLQSHTPRITRVVCSLCVLLSILSVMLFTVVSISQNKTDKQQEVFKPQKGGSLSAHSIEQSEHSG